ncbi:MAG: hypothetical protein J6Y77_05425 [Paludibacteraceae bacterium]|nr:hypothetical protein [Paludibacteraceae bacterium]
MAKKKTGYNWKFSKIGGVTRVNIESGADIAHLGELDQKLWTVLSCPVKGLELDETTLAMMDTDHDGKIRVNEVVEHAQWLCSVLKNPDVLLRQSGELSLAEINEASEAGAKILQSARQILKNLGIEGDRISIANTSDSLAIFAKTRFNGDGVITEASTDDEALKAAIKACIDTIGSTPDRSGEAGINADQIEAFYTALNDYAAWNQAAQEPGVLAFGGDTDAALSAVKALQTKVADFFMRCKLAAFDASSASSLDMSAARIEAISAEDLTACGDQIAACPLARVNAEGLLPIDGTGINPAWQGVFGQLRSLVFAKEFGKKKTIGEADWNALVAKFAAYEAWKAAKKGDSVEALGLETVQALVKADAKAALLELVAQDQALEAEAAEIQSVDKLLHLSRDFYALLKNFVTLSDFYCPDALADFQAGTLYIDQRSCDLCLKVSDMGKHNAMAHLSGMYLLYCDCHSKVKNQTMTIVAVMTNGDVNDLMVGKNAIFYDRDGLDWDATVVKIVENPISIRQAFWSPYRKMARFVEDQVNKFAASRDEKVTADATGKIGDAGTKLTTEAEAADINLKNSQAQAFDIAKFAGIFAAIGMAVGMIGSALVACAKGFMGLTWWQMPLVILGLMLLISGPSMIMAWLKLRKRSVSPLLNANGWAVNAQTIVNIRFGATLTKIAQFPKVAAKDPFAEKGIPAWRKILYLLIVLGGIFAALYFTGKLDCIGLPYPKPAAEAVEEVVVEETPAAEEAPVAEEAPAAEEAAETPAAE